MRFGVEAVRYGELDRLSNQIVPKKCAQLAHYSKGACASVGANAAAAVFKRIEKQAACQAFEECGISLANLAVEIDRLRHEAVAF